MLSTTHSSALLCALFVLTGESPSRLARADSEPPEAPRETGLAKDLQLLRKTIRDPRSGLRLSSPEAKQAAHRIFGRVHFLGRTRAQILWMLGDPETLSDYGRKPKPGKDASLIYCFYNDDGGRCYIVAFKNGRVTKVHGKPKSDE